MTNRMNREKVLEAVAAARDKAALPDLSGMDLCCLDLTGMDLHGAYLHGADLRGTNLTGANLRHANLAHTDMRYTILRDTDLTGAILRDANLSYAVLSDANLSGAKLIGAGLRGAYLRGAVLTGVYLRGADMRDVKLCGLFLDGLPSGDLAFLPTPGGWQLIIGCWSGTTDTLRAMIAGEDWPEAEGEQIVARRPMLEGAAAACDAYAAANPHALAEARAAAARWEESR